MDFTITGIIREKESGLGVGGLMVRAYDKDLLFDDLLSTARTNKDGRFEMHYSEKDFRELFEKKPDIYLVIYAPPCRLLLDTKESVRWGASEHEHFEIEIDRATLGNFAPTLPDDQVSATDPTTSTGSSRGDSPRSSRSAGSAAPSSVPVSTRPSPSCGPRMPWFTPWTPRAWPSSTPMGPARTRGAGRGARRSRTSPRRPPAS